VTKTGIIVGSETARARRIIIPEIMSRIEAAFSEVTNIIPFAIK